MKRQGGRSQLCAHNGVILETDGECDQHVHVCGVCECVCVAVAVDDPAGASFPSLPARPGEALMWQRQSLWSTGLTLWCCGRDAEPVSTNPISITLAASYLWLRWPSALPPPHKSSPLPLSLPLSLYIYISLSLNVSLPSSPFIFPALYPSLISFCLLPSSSLLIGVPWQSFWCNIVSTQRCQKWNRRGKKGFMSYFRLMKMHKLWWM